MTGKEYLNRLVEADREINRKQLRFENLKSMATDITPHYSEDYVQRSRSGDTFGTTMAELIDLENEINDDIDALVELKREAWAKIDKMDDELYKRILWLRYAERKTWDGIAEAVNYTPRYVIVLHGKALAQFDKTFHSIS